MLHDGNVGLQNRWIGCHGNGKCYELRERVRGESGCYSNQPYAGDGTGVGASVGHVPPIAVRIGNIAAHGDALASRQKPMSDVVDDYEFSNKD